MNPRLCSGSIGSLLVGYILSTASIQAQHYAPSSLLDTYEHKVRYYYVKPVFGFHWSYSTIQADPQFSKVDRFNLRNERYGLLVGYHTGRFDLETGMVTLPVYTGYHFTSTDNFMIGSGVRVTYFHFPLHSQYTLWQPAKRLQVRVLAGIAFNVERGENLLPSRTTGYYLRINSRGDKSQIESIQDTHYKTQFGSATVGINLTYQLLKRVDLSLQTSRLFSARSILRQDVQLKEESNSTLYRATTQAGAGGLSIGLGIAYKLSSTGTYKPY